MSAKICANLNSMFLANIRSMITFIFFSFYLHLNLNPKQISHSYDMYSTSNKCFLYIKYILYSLEIILMIFYMALVFKASSSLQIFVFIWMVLRFISEKWHLNLKGTTLCTICHNNIISRSHAYIWLLILGKLIVKLWKI